MALKDDVYKDKYLIVSKSDKRKMLLIFSGYLGLQSVALFSKDVAEKVLAEYNNDDLEVISYEEGKKDRLKEIFDFRIFETYEDWEKF